MRKLLSITVLFIAVLTLSGCFKSSQPEYAIDLELWGVADDSDAYQNIFGEYKKINPFIGQFGYRKFLVDDYKKDLLDALAAGNGPDAFLIHSSWLPEFKDKIIPADANILNESVFRQNFVDVAADDFVDEGQVYAVPLSVDSLALYYNKDLLNFEGITAPPMNWEEFNDAVRKLTRIGDRGEITQSGAALGTAYNINRSTDILNMLFFQSGVSFDASSGGGVRFGKAGENALSFYAQFADASSPLYTWNRRQHYSLDSFYEGTAAMMLNYSWHYDTIKRKNAKLNFAVAPLPQSSGAKVNYANYWGWAVAKNKTDETATDPQAKNNARIHEAWEFLRFLTVNNGNSLTLTNAITGNPKTFPLSVDPAKMYAEKTRKPAARRDLVEVQKSDPVLGPFAYGNIIAKSWRQSDSAHNETVMADAIDAVNRGELTVAEAVRLMEERIQAASRK